MGYPLRPPVSVPRRMNADSPARRAPRLLSGAIGVIVSAVLLVLLLHNVDIPRLGDDLARANRWLLLAATLPSFVILVLKVERWRVLFGSEAPPRGVLFAALNVGYAVNSLLPARAGDLTSAYWLRRTGGVGLVRALSTIAVERVADGITVSLLLLSLTRLISVPARFVDLALVAVGVFLLLLIGMTALVYVTASRRLAVRVVDTRWGYLVARLIDGARQAVAGLTVLRSPRTAAWFVVWTLLIWASTVAQLGFALRAFNLQLPVMAVVLLTAVIFLGMAIPSAPAYIGVFDYLMVVVLGLYGVPRTPALAAALGYHAIVFLPVTVIGMGYIIHAGSRTALQVFRIGATRAAD